MTGLLLDTHVVLWWLADDSRLTGEGRRVIGAAPSVHVSAASTWEVANKVAIGKLAFDDDIDFPQLCAEQGFDLVGVDHRDAWSITALPASRTDPFDRLIAATARRRGWTVVTADEALAALGVAVQRP